MLNFSIKHDCNPPLCIQCTRPPPLDSTPHEQQSVEIEGVQMNKRLRCQGKKGGELKPRESKQVAVKSVPQFHTLSKSQTLQDPTAETDQRPWGGNPNC